MEIRESGASLRDAGSLFTDPIQAEARAGWHPRCPKSSPPGAGGALGEQMGVGGVRVAHAEARTPGAKLPIDRPRGRPGPPSAGCTAPARARPAAAAAGELRFAM